MGHKETIEVYSGQRHGVGTSFTTDPSKGQWIPKPEWQMDIKAVAEGSDFVGKMTITLPATPPPTAAELNLKAQMENRTYRVSTFDTLVSDPLEIAAGLSLVVTLSLQKLQPPTGPSVLQINHAFLFSDGAVGAWRCHP